MNYLFMLKFQKQIRVNFDKNSRERKGVSVNGMEFQVYEIRWT